MRGADPSFDPSLTGPYRTHGQLVGACASEQRGGSNPHVGAVTHLFRIPFPQGSLSQPESESHSGHARDEAQSNSPTFVSHTRIAMIRTGISHGLGDQGGEQGGDFVAGQQVRPIFIFMI